MTTHTIRSVIYSTGVPHPLYSTQKPEDVQRLVEAGQEQFAAEDGAFLPAMVKVPIVMSHGETGDQQEVPCWVSPGTVAAIYGAGTWDA